MENTEGWAEKEKNQGCMGQERRPTFCLGTHYAEIFKFTSVYAEASSTLICKIKPPTPVLIRRFYWWGATRSRLIEAAWWYLFVNYGKMQGENNEARGSFTSQCNSRFTCSSKGNAISTVLNFFCFKFKVVWILLLGISYCIILRSFVQ